MVEKINNEFIEFWFEGDILNSKFSVPVELNLKIGKKMIDIRHKISNGKKQYWLYDFTNVTAMPKECRDYADKYGQDFLYASAGITKNKIQVFIINIFIRLKNPKIPFRAFGNKEDALNWLLAIKAQNELTNGIDEPIYS